MQITISTITGDVCSIEVHSDMDYTSFCALICQELQFPSGSHLVLIKENNPIRPSSGKSSLESIGLRHGDMILATVLPNVRPGSGAASGGTKRPASSHSSGGAMGGIDFSQIKLPVGGASSKQHGSRSSHPTSSSNSRPGSSAAGASSSFKVQRSRKVLPSDQELSSEAELLRQSLLCNPGELAVLRDRNPPLAEAVNNQERFVSMVVEAQKKAFSQAMELEALMSGNPYDPQVQAKIEELIRQQNIEQDLMNAMEHHPEHFARVTMLYINCKVFGHPLKAFVDSGAETTIMSEACARRCNVDRLIDKRFAGIAKGVGTQRIIGRVHSGVIQIGPDHLSTSFTVLQEQQMDLLIGLDMLKRHQCCIDLKRNVLVIGTTGSETSFLPEAELPDYARPSYEDPELASQLRGRQPHAASGSSSANNATMVDESMVARITHHGFSREAAEQALIDADGDLDAALASLVEKSFGGGI